MFRSGQQIGLYTLIVKLGRGGFGEVWLAEKRSQFVTKKVAVKLPHEEQVNFDAIRQEATLWEQASGHPNVLPIIDADVYDGQVVIVSEYADGGSLADKLKREEKLPLKQAVEMTIGIVSGLEFLHNRQIIHRDIKPQNILIQGNTPRLADFGISRAMQTTVVSSAIIGTDAYMSPEAFDGKRNAQTDIWSVGVVLYQLLKGSLPFPQEHPSERMFAVLTKEFEPLPNDVPADLRRIVQKSLAKQPEQRYQSCAEMNADLRKALAFIEHPTFAPTEFLIKPDLSYLESDAPTVAADSPAHPANQPFVVPIAPPPVNNTQADETEIRTVVGKTPFNQPAPTQPAFAQTPAAPEFQISEIKPAPYKANSLVSLGHFEKSIAIIVGLIFLAIVSVFIFNSSSKNQSTKTDINIYPNNSFANSSRNAANTAANLLNSFANARPANANNPSNITSNTSDMANSLLKKNGGKYGYAYYVGKDNYQVCKEAIYSGTCGLIDSSGREITPMTYDNFSVYIGEYIEGIRGDKKYKLDKYGNETISGAANTNSGNASYNSSNYAANANH